jgi:O-antigen/teichoic acid export membrane protein
MKPPLQQFFRSAFLLLLLNAAVKPVWIFIIDRQAQLTLGPQVYGGYFSLLSLSLIFNMVADAGLSVYYNRRLAAHGMADAGVFKRFLTIKLWLLAAYALVVMFTALAWQIPFTLLLLLLIVLQAALSLLVFLRSHLTALQLFSTDAVLSVLDKLLVILAGGTFLFVLRPGVFTVTVFALIQVLAVLAAVVAALYYVRATLRRNLPEGNVRAHTGFRLKEALPYTLVVLLMAALYRADVLLLARLHPQGAAQAGLYAYGFRLLDALNMPGYLLAAFLLPFISRHAASKPVVSRAVGQVSMLLFLFAAVLVSFCVFNRQWLFSILYHQQNEAAALTTAWVITALAGCSLVHIYSTVLTALGRIRTLLYITAFFAVAAVTANIIFIPLYGARGSAVIAAAVQLGYAIALWRAVAMQRLLPAQRFQYKWLLPFIIIVPLLLLLQALHPLLQFIIVSAAVALLTLKLRMIEPGWWQKIKVPA